MPGTGTVLLAQAGMWFTDEHTLPVLLVEQATGVKHASDAGEDVDPLLSTVLGGGLEFVTDPAHILVTSAPGWQVALDPTGSLTIEWPGQRATLQTSAFRPPTRWHETARAIGYVIIICGDGLGLRDQQTDDAVPLSVRVYDAAHCGMLAVGAAAYRCIS